MILIQRIIRIVTATIMLTRKCGSCDRIATWRPHYVAPVVLNSFWLVLCCACCLPVFIRFAERAHGLVSNDVFTLWPWALTLDLEQMPRDQTWLKSNNQLRQRSHWSFSTFSPALRHAVTLIFNPITLNVCCISDITWSSYVPNLNETDHHTLAR